MVARVISSYAAASNTPMKARASISVQTPIAGVYAQIPVSAISYIELSVSAELDITGRYRLATETVNLFDGTQLTPTKVFGDSLFVALDQVELNVHKDLDDPVTPFEDLRYSMAKRLQESYGLTDAHAISFATSAASLVVSGDTSVNHFFKVLNDGFAMNDTFDATDGLLYTITKSINNVAFATDKTWFDSEKLLADQQDIVDQPFKDVGRPLFDDYALIDLAALEPHKSLFDSQGLLDELTRDTSKGLFDLVEPIESLAFDVNQSLSDSQILNDALAKVLTKPLAHSFTQTDALTHAAGKYLANTAFAADSFDRTVVYARVFQDGVGINDQAGIGDGVAFTFNALFSNVAFAGDTTRLAPSLVKQDLFSTTDTGSLVSQGYCDLTYFAEDYVGSYRSF